MSKIKYILQCYHSKMDTCGNRYWFAVLTRTSDAKQVRFVTDHESNAGVMVCDLAGGWSGVHQAETVEMPSRKYWAVTKEMPYVAHTDQLKKRSIWSK